MNKYKYAALAVFAGCMMMVSAPKAGAQVSLQIGAAPECPYGYYDAAPYECAPYGYYGREWFTNGIFIGTGPWFHGSERFRGHVDNRFHPEHGYTGRRPERGERAERANRTDRIRNFRGNEMRDGHGHVSHDRGHDHDRR